MSGSMRQVRFPLKLKLLALMIVLIAASLIVFVGIALKTFREDKSAYIFETMLNKAASEQIILSQKLGQSSFRIEQGTLRFGDKDPSEILNDALTAESTYGLKVVVPFQGKFYEWSKGTL